VLLPSGKDTVGNEFADSRKERMDTVWETKKEPGGPGGEGKKNECNGFE